MSKFKEGDKVKVIGTNSDTVGFHPAMSRLLGQKVSIIEVSDRDDEVYEVESEHDRCWFNGSDLELVDTSTEVSSDVSSRSFKVGDKVLITEESKTILLSEDAWNSDMDITINKVGIVTDTLPVSNRVEVTFEDEDYWYYHLKGLELVQEDKKESQSPERSFPRKMLVWDTKGETPIERIVVAFCEGRTEPWITADDWDDIDDSGFEGYTHAKELDDVEEYDENKIYLLEGGCTAYKLHRIADDRFAWIDLETSMCYANGVFDRSDLNDRISRPGVKCFENIKEAIDSGFFK